MPAICTSPDMEISTLTPRHSAPSSAALSPGRKQRRSPSITIVAVAARPTLGTDEGNGLLPRRSWGLCRPWLCGAGPLEPWETVRTSLPPAGCLGVRSLPEKLITPNLPQRPRAKAARMIVPASNQVPVSPAIPPAVMPLTAQRCAVPGCRSVYPARAGQDRLGCGDRSHGRFHALHHRPSDQHARLRHQRRGPLWLGLPLRNDRPHSLRWLSGHALWVVVSGAEVRSRNPGPLTAKTPAQFVIIGYSFGVYRAKPGWPTASLATAFRSRWSATSAAITCGCACQPDGGRTTRRQCDGRWLSAHWSQLVLQRNAPGRQADNLRMPGIRHFGLPKQEQTVTVLLNGMNAASGGANCC